MTLSQQFTSSLSHYSNYLEWIFERLNFAEENFFIVGGV